MRRLLLKPSSNLATPQISTNLARAPLLSEAQIEARLRQPRSRRFIEAITRLDAGHHTHNRATFEELMGLLAEEFPELEPQSFPLGIVGKCYLGAPYEVHTLDVSGQIIHHYKTFESLPSLLECARSLALNPAYVFIEVYHSKIIAVADSGATSVISR